MKTRNAALASAAAALFVAGIGGHSTPAMAEDGDKIKCEGVNSCKAASDCKTLVSDCAGHNDCKGKGFVMLSPEECDEAKAKIADESEES